MNANIWRVCNSVKRKVACVQKYLRLAGVAGNSVVCADENRGVIDWRVLRRELAVARIKAGLEEDELARAIEVDVSTVYRIEKSGSGKNNPSLDIIAKWVDRCGLTLSAFTALVEAGTLTIQHVLPETGEHPRIAKSTIPLPKVNQRVHGTAPSGTEPPTPAPAQLVSADPADHEQSRTVPDQADLEAVMREMRNATTALLKAFDYTAAAGGGSMAKPGRQAAKARAALARKRARPRKNG